MERLAKKPIIIGLLIFFGLFLILISFPTALTLTTMHGQERANRAFGKEFPVTVDPEEKTITENHLVDSYFETLDSPLAAAVGPVGGALGKLFATIAIAIGNASWYANAVSANERFVAISPGMRKEQVANAFALALSWTGEEKSAFLVRGKYATLPLIEGSYAPGIYLVEKDATPQMAQALVNDRFAKEIIARYGKKAAEALPLEDAIIIASLIEREAAGPEDMRLVSGVIWNRLFIDMHLQIDATLQYAKASAAKSGNWWPRPTPQDRFIRSPYNTYLNKGLPPGPIANPSVASVLAALNPKKTDCLFYFHDSLGRFHCSATYEGHVALLKKYYGRGK